MPPILLLHLSDLHFGPHSRFQGEKPERLGKSFHRALAVAQKQLGIERKVDLVFVTGDIAESGLPAEFQSGHEFLSALAGEIGLPPQKFVFVPGNHDVNWDACQEAFFRARKEGRTSEAEIRSALDLAKFEFYDAFVQSFYRKKDPRAPLARGAFLYRYEELNLAVAALNSCEKESHRSGDHVGYLSQSQVESAIGALRRDDLASWLKVVVVHHNPAVTTPANLDSLLRSLHEGADEKRVGWLQILATALSPETTDDARIKIWQEALRQKSFDPDLLGRFVSDAIGFGGRKELGYIVEDSRVQLVLHGHHHAKDESFLPWEENGFAHVLSAGSLWLRPDKLPGNEPASARLVFLDPEEAKIHAWSLIFSERARTEGEARLGTFTIDSAPKGYHQRLDLPVGYAAPELYVRSQTKKAKISIDTEFLHAFRQRFAEQYAPWDLGSLGAVRPSSIHETKESRLDDMYLELRLSPNLGSEENRKGEPLRVEDLLNRDRPVVITGAAGAGKTTWARYTFRQLLKDERALPLMLVLRDVARSWQQPGSMGEDHSIDAALDTWIGAQMGSGWKGHLAKVLQAEAGPRPILLVDGWDELGPLGEKFRDQLMDFLRANPRVLAVVTSRPYGEQKPSHSDGFKRLEVQPLSNADIDALTRKFFRQFSAEEAATLMADSFLSALERATEARSLARTPLLLTMMLLVGRSQPLPDQRHQIYGRCIDTLLHARPEQKAGEGALNSRHAWCPSGLDQRRRWAATLAYWAQVEAYEQNKGKSGIEHTSFVRTWKELVSFLPGECLAESRDGFLTWLVEVAGLLVERTDGTLSFTHLSFQEYLAALHLATTAAGHEQRLSAFRDHVGDVLWWETLRLLAAQIDGANPEFLEFALRALLEEANAPTGTLSFLGTVLADGLGSERLFTDWTYLYLPLLPPRWPDGADLCARAWQATRQEGRKGFLAQRLEELAPSQSWLGWQRCEIFSDGRAPISDSAQRATTNGIVRSLRTLKNLSREAAAAGRILAGSHPAWPVDHEIGALHLWPGHRRHAGLRLQSAVLAGAPRESLIALARKALIPPLEDTQARIRAQVQARDLTLDLVRGWDRDLISDWDRYWARDWAFYWALYLPLDWDLDWTRGWIRGWVRGWDRDLASDWARDLARDQDRGWDRDCIEHLDFDSKAVWLEDFALTEFNSRGRASARGYFARVERSQNPLQCLLSEACRSSFDPDRETSFDLHNPKGLDPLWSALARHIARMSTPEDKVLLEALARGDEERPEPLSWGLQFIVRGDVLLDDGSVVTLDELADEAGVPRLPYLEEMEPELEVDWDAIDEEAPEQ